MSLSNGERARIQQEKLLGKIKTLIRLRRKSFRPRRGAGKGNRTLIASLEGWSFTIKLCPLEISRRRGHGAGEGVK